MATLNERGIRTDLSAEVLAEITWETPEAAIGTLDASLETEQLMAKKAIQLMTAGDTDSARAVLMDSIEYAGYRRAQIKEFEKRQAGEVQ